MYEIHCRKSFETKLNNYVSFQRAELFLLNKCKILLLNFRNILTIEVAFKRLSIYKSPHLESLLNQANVSK